MTRRFLFIFSLFLQPISSSRGDKDPRYLYIVTCAATVLKADFIQDQLVSSINLHQTAPAWVPAYPQGNITFDGCLANGSHFYPDSVSFDTIVPAQARLDDPSGQRKFSRLTFAVPSLHLTKSAPVGSGGVESQASVERALPSELDLSSYLPAKKKIGNEVLEETAGYFLLHVFTGDPNVFAIADSHANALTIIRAEFNTSSELIHLTPGGKQVFAQELDSPSFVPTTTERAVVLDSQTGKVLKNLSDPRLKQYRFLTIVPNGKAIFKKSNELWFCNLGESASNAPIRRSKTTAGPWYFVAQR